MRSPRGLARKREPQGNAANLILPGPIDTEMNPANGSSADVPASMVPLGRFGEPNDIAAAVAFLASPAASLLTGATLPLMLANRRSRG